MTRTQCLRWGLLALLLLLAKGMIVLSMGDVFFYGEELEKGTAAKAMIDGLGVPHYQLAYHYYEGGGFVISHCMAVAFLIVGESLLALKLVALGFQLLILGAGCWMALRLFGKTAATCFGLLFILGPTSIQKLSLLSLGIHFEAGLFLFGALGFGARILFGGSLKRRDWFLLGLVTGFGIYFSYMVGVLALWLALALLVRKPGALASPCGAAMALGALCGLIPWFVMYALVGGEMFNVHGVELLTTPSFAQNWTLLGDTLESLFFTAEGEFVLTVWLRAAVFLGALSFLLWSKRPQAGCPDSRTGALYLVGYMSLFVLLLLFSGFLRGQIEFFFDLMRFVPLWLISTVIVGAAIGGLWDSRLTRQRGLAAVLLAVLIGVGVHDTRTIVVEGRPEQIATNWELLRTTKGYSYPQYFEKVMPHFEGDLADKLELIESFQDPAPGLVRTSAVSVLIVSPYQEADPDAPGSELQQATQLLRRVAGEDEQRLAHYELGLGKMIVQLHGWRRAEAMRWAWHLPEGLRASGLHALGRFGWKGNPTETSLIEALHRAANHKDMGAYIRGLGRWSYRAYRLNPEGFEALASGLSSGMALELTEGFEAERGWNLLTNESRDDPGLASF